MKHKKYIKDNKYIICLLISIIIQFTITKTYCERSTEEIISILLEAREDRKHFTPDDLDILDDYERSRFLYEYYYRFNESDDEIEPLEKTVFKFIAIVILYLFIRLFLFLDETYWPSINEEPSEDIQTEEQSENKDIANSTTESD